MSDDPSNPDEEPRNLADEQESEAPDAGHDDIMKRLVDYQRQLRQGVEPTEAAAVAWHREQRDPVQPEPPGRPPEEPDFVDVSSPEPGVEAEAEPEPEVRAGEPEEIETAQPPDRVEILTQAEVEASPARPWQSPPAPGRETTRTDVSARIAQLEGTLDRLSKLLGDLRENFQGMAVTADERLAVIEAEIERNRERPDDPS